MTGCECYCHVNPSATCTVDMGGSGVPGKPYCGPHGSGEGPERPPVLLGSVDVWKAVDQLVKPTTRKLWRDDGKTSYMQKVAIPSLLDQLIEAMESGAGSKGRGRQLSKPPLDTAALALLIDIAEHIRSGCWNWRVKRTRDLPADLTGLADRVLERGNPVEVHMLATKIRDWCSRIKATISSDTNRTWRMRGKCTLCQSETIQAWDDDGTIHRQPALIAHSDDGIIRKVECSFCGSVLGAADLTRLVNDTLTLIARESA